MNSIGTCGASSRQPSSCASASPLAKGAVADLIVVLQEGDEGLRRQRGAGFAARLPITVCAGLALVDEALGQRACQHGHRRIVIVRVVALGLAGGQHMRGVMPVVVPLRACDARASPT
jgi:hypothetical protein